MGLSYDNSLESSWKSRTMSDILMIALLLPCLVGSGGENIQIDPSVTSHIDKEMKYMFGPYGDEVPGNTKNGNWGKAIYIEGGYRNAIFKIKNSSNKTEIFKRTVLNENATGEEEILKGLNHPNIVGMLAHTKSPENPFATSKSERSINWMLFEYLDQLITPESVDREKVKLKKIISSTLEALKYLHRKSIAHLNIKCSNIMEKKESDKSVRYVVKNLRYAKRINSGKG